MNQIKNEKLKERLLNWKFESATIYLKEETNETKYTVKALADIFGDVGWFEGALGIIVSQTLKAIGIDRTE